MTHLRHLFRAALSAGVVATVALSGIAHAQSSSEIARYNPKTHQYCVTRAVPGSILPRQFCATRQGWINLGAVVTPARTQLAAR